MNKRTVGFLNILLLLAAVNMAIPFHLAFHHHNQNENYTVGKHVHKHEKTCCKPVNFLNKQAALLPQEQFCFLTDFSAFEMPIKCGIAVKQAIDLLNKAPPVKA